MSQSYDRISLYGLYQYRNDILDGLVLPNPFDTADINNIKNNILLESAELELYYTDPDFLKFAIGIWSTKMIPNWSRIMEALNAEYNPIENYDRQEHWTDSGSGNRVKNLRNAASQSSYSSTDTEASSEGQSTNDINSTSNGQNNTEQLNSNTGMNDPSQATGLAVHDKSEGSTVNSVADNSHSATASTSSNTGSNITAGQIRNTSDGNEQENHITEGEHEGRIHGNIGVTTAMQMITEEVELRRKYNIVDIIVQDFINEFCLRVY